MTTLDTMNLPFITGREQIEIERQMHAEYMRGRADAQSPAPAALTAAERAVFVALDKWYKGWSSGIEMPAEQTNDPSVKNIRVDSSDDELFRAYRTLLALRAQEPQS